MDRASVRTLGPFLYDFTIKASHAGRLFDMYVSYTLYPSEIDPHRGKRPCMVGMTFKPTPNLTKEELAQLIAELQSIANQMT